MQDPTQTLSNAPLFLVKRVTGGQFFIGLYEIDPRTFLMKLTPMTKHLFTQIGYHAKKLLQTYFRPEL